MSQKLEYEIDSTGSVIKVKTMENDVTLEITWTRVDRLPWHSSQKHSRWTEFKQQIAKQEPGVWYVYGGFTTPEQVKQANGVFGRYRSDKFFQRYLNGHRLTSSINRKTMELAVMVVKADDSDDVEATLGVIQPFSEKA